MEAIRGAEHVVAIFGSWPSFHDAEVLRLTLSRDHTRRDADAPFIDLDIYAFDTDGTVTEQGYYRLTNEVVVTFRFHRVDAVMLEDFNQQNVLGSLTITPARDADGQTVLEVELESIFGLGGRFQCKIAEVLAVRPWAKGQPSSSEVRDA